MFDSKKYDSTNQENKKIPTLDFDGKKYDINLLTDEVKKSSQRFTSCRYTNSNA